MSMFNGTTQKYLASLGNTSSSSDNMPFTIIYPNKDGTTGGANPNYNPPSSASSSKSDPYGGTPININVGNSAKGLDSVSASLNSGFSGLFDLISKNTDKNNAWSASQAQKQMDFQERMNYIAQEFNAGEAAKNRDWQEYMSNTAHQREVADLQAAGLNPVLSASGGNGASVGSGAAASVAAPSGSKGDTDTSANQALVSIYGALINAQTQMANANLSARTNLAMAEMQREASMYGSQLAANASMYGSAQAAQASMYATDYNWKNNEAQRDWNAQHPSNAYQTGSSLLHGLADITGYSNSNSVSAKARNELSVLGRLKNKIFG